MYLINVAQFIAITTVYGKEEYKNLYILLKKSPPTILIDR